MIKVENEKQRVSIPLSGSQTI